jgi:plastocyanin
VNLIVAPLVRGALLALVLLQTLNACSADATARGRKAPSSADTPPAPAAAAKVVDLGGSSYKVVTLTAVGSVSGTVTRSDSAAGAIADLARDSLAVECGSAPPPKGRRRTTGTTQSAVPSAVVWIVGVTAGKAFPEEKRTELESADCDLDPSTLAIAVGTTVNVVNDDRVLHRLIFTRADSHDTLATMPFYNEGEVVPSERLAKTPGVIDVRCVIHRLTRARITVFGHPYFAATNDAGHFTIDSLPPGSYSLHVWPDGAAQPTQQQVTITAGTTAKADVKLTASR